MKHSSFLWKHETKKPLCEVEWRKRSECKKSVFRRTFLLRSFDTFTMGQETNISSLEPKTNDKGQKGSIRSNKLLLFFSFHGILKRKKRDVLHRNTFPLLCFFLKSIKKHHNRIHSIQ